MMKIIRNGFHPKEKRPIPTQPSVPPIPAPRHRYITATEAKRLSEINRMKKETDNIEKQKSLVMEIVSDHINEGKLSCEIRHMKLYPEVIQMLHDLGYKITRHEWRSYSGILEYEYEINWEIKEDKGGRNG